MPQNNNNRLSREQRQHNLNTPGCGKRELPRAVVSDSGYVGKRVRNESTSVRTHHGPGALNVVTVLLALGGGTMTYYMMNVASQLQGAASPVASAETLEVLEDDSIPMAAPANNGITLFVGGDVMLSEEAQLAYRQEGLSALFSEDLTETMTDADLCLINAEFAVTEAAAVTENPCTALSPDLAGVLAEAGVDYAALANNHSMDYGVQGLQDTVEALTSGGISCGGAGASLEEAAALVTYTIDGKTIGVLNATRVLPDTSWSIQAPGAEYGVLSSYDPTALLEQVAAADASCDVLVVYMHWGTLGSTELTDYQTEQAHLLADAGADLIVGAHPHVVQGAELYHGTPIFYSLGNLLFADSDYNQAALQVTINKDNSLTCRILPVDTYEGTSRLISEANRQTVLDTVEELSPNAVVDPDGIVRFSE